MAVSNEYIEYILDQLSALGPVRSRKMFGGAGIYYNDLFFALISDDRLYFKVDKTNRSDYEKAGMNQFKPFPEKPATMPYFEVPPEILENRETLQAWAQKSITIAATKKKQ